MKFTSLFVGILLLAGAALLAGHAPDVQSLAPCRFTLDDKVPTQPTLTGPEDIVSRVYFVAQPDSPVEILSVKLVGSSLIFQGDHLSQQLRCKVKLRNRSNQPIREILVRVGGGGRFHPSRGQTLAPGQETKFFSACGGLTTGTTRDGPYRILVHVEWVDFSSCRYFPSGALPYSLRHSPGLGRSYVLPVNEKPLR